MDGRTGPSKLHHGSTGWGHNEEFFAIRAMCLRENALVYLVSRHTDKLQQEEFVIFFTLKMK